MKNRWNTTNRLWRMGVWCIAFVLLGLVGGLSGCGLEEERPQVQQQVAPHIIESCGLPFTPVPEPSSRAANLPDDLGTLTSAMACGPGSKQFPDTRTFTTSPEPYAKYVGQTSCSPTAKKGMKAFRDLILKTYPCTGDFGISRACSSGGKSEHKEGRAWDWKLNYPHPAADAVIDWLLKTRNGVAHAYARRIGLMYMIWNRKIWKAYQASKGWQKYTGASPHTDHVHFSLSVPGGNGDTSFWKGEISAPETLDAKFENQGTKQAGGPSNGAQHSLCPGQKFEFWFKVKNTGTLTWSDVNKNEPGKAVRLGFKQGETFGIPSRVSINDASSKTVAPGASVTFTLKGTAPTTPGVYKTEWRLVSELVKWFGPEMWLTFHVTGTPPKAGDSCQVQGQGGNCGQGKLTCTAQGLVCVAAKGSEEVCDNQDNDCNGLVDDGLNRRCYNGPAGTKDVGACRSGTQICKEGKWGECLGEIQPAAQETCGNTQDDNCNGQIDEGCSSAGGCEDKDGDGYGTGAGCPGEKDCNDDDKSIYPGAPEICGNNKDDDCRGGDQPCGNNSGEPGNNDPKSCDNPPCGITQLTPPGNNPPTSQPKITVRGGGCGCAVMPARRKLPMSSLLWLGLVLLWFQGVRRRR